MTNYSIYLPLVIDGDTARKIHIISKHEGLSPWAVASNIIKESLQEREVPDIFIKHNISRKIDDLSSTRKRIGNRIAYLRKINYLSQSALAEAINAEQQTISLIETGNRRLDVTEAHAIAQVLGVTIEDILDDTC